MNRLPAKIVRIMRRRTCCTCFYGLNNYCNVHSVKIVDPYGCDLWIDRVIAGDARSRIAEWLLCELHSVLKWLMRKIEGEKHEQLHK
jgi:hypothetical protein